MIYGFEKLEVWKKSKDLVVKIYVLTKDFPHEEKFGLTSQIRRSAVSVSSNLAEGSTRQSPKDRARFYEISFGSLIELLNQLIISEQLGFLKADLLNQIRPEIESISRMINGLHKSTKS